jgi:hypothetical protein
MANSGYLYTDAGSGMVNISAIRLHRLSKLINFPVDELPAILRDLWLNRSKLPLAQIVSCLFVYFSITLAFTVWETLGPALTLEKLKWDVVDNSLLYMGMGVTAGVTLVMLKGITKVLLFPLPMYPFYAHAILSFAREDLSCHVWLPSWSLVRWSSASLVQYSGTGSCPPLS